MKEEVNAKTTTTGTAPEKHLPESTRRPSNNNINEDTRERGASNQPITERRQQDENNPPPVIICPPRTGEVQLKAHEDTTRGEI